MQAAPIDHGALAQEVINLKEGHGQLRQDMRNLEGKVDSGFALLVQKFDSNRQSIWAPIGILIPALLTLAGLIIWPIRESITRNEAVLELMRKEDEARIVKLWDAHNQLARDHAYLQGQLHPLPKP
jgi:hypothetical protein